MVGQIKEELGRILRQNTVNSSAIDEKCNNCAKESPNKHVVQSMRMLNNEMNIRKFHNGAGAAPWPKWAILIRAQQNSQVPNMCIGLNINPTRGMIRQKKKKKIVCVSITSPEKNSSVGHWDIIVPDNNPYPK
uniref:Uncharacterized protein n=1 Tax=Romanomermis culicivorax TaxID=13658 RepID=A0A915LCU9_ROMCU